MASSTYTPAVQQWFKNQREYAKRYLPAANYESFINILNFKEQEQMKGWEHVKDVGDGKIQVRDGQLSDGAKIITGNAQKFPNGNPESIGATEGKAGGPTVEQLVVNTALDDRDWIKNKAAPKTDTSGIETAQAAALAKIEADKNVVMEMAANHPSVKAMLELSRGEGPAAEAAKAALRRGLDSANAQAMSQAASSRGGAGASALAMRSAIQAGAKNAMTAANESAALMADMSLKGVEGLAKQRAEDIDAGVSFANKTADLGSGFRDNLTSAATTDTQAAGQHFSTQVQGVGGTRSDIIDVTNPGNRTPAPGSPGAAPPDPNLGGAGMVEGSAGTYAKYAPNPVVDVNDPDNFPNQGTQDTEHTPAAPQTTQSTSHPGATLPTSVTGAPAPAPKTAATAAPGIKAENGRDNLTLGRTKGWYY